MKMQAADIKTYPKLAYYVKTDLPKIVDVPALVLMLNRIGQVNRSKLRSALEWGFGPVIKVTVMTPLGEFTPGSGSNELRIQTALVREFESGKGRRAARAGNVYLVGVTLLHELVHWGDDQDKVDRTGEEGEEFERAIYGSVIK